MMSSITKNVRRYAEVGYQRLGTAIPITITDQDVSHFAILSAELCLACQVKIICRVSFGFIDTSLSVRRWMIGTSLLIKRDRSSLILFKEYLLQKRLLHA